MVMDNLDREILYASQDGIPLVKQPFFAIAAHLGITQREVVERLQRLREKKVIRKFGLFMWKNKIGVVANAMVVWAVPRERLESVAEFFSGFDEVTHCYERRTTPEWNYNLYTMIHGAKRKSVKGFVEMLSAEAGLDDYLILFSVREFVRRSTGAIRP